MMAEPEPKYNLEGLSSISMLIGLDGSVSSDLLASETMEDLAKMIERGHSGEWSGTQ